MELSGKVAIVTGAAQGLGRAYSLALAQAGAQVVASSRSMGNAVDGEEPDESSLAKTRAISVEMGCPVDVAVCDIGIEKEIKNVVDETVGKYGRVDILINNAATYPAHYAPEFMDPMNYTDEVWHQYFHINVVGPYNFIRAVAPYMKAQKSGSIINVSSAAAFLTKFDPNDTGHEKATARPMLGYGASKAAMARMAHHFAMELSTWNIAVNTICPGTVITGAWRSVPADQIEMARNSGVATDATPEAVGPYILDLAKQTAQGLTGNFLEVKNYPNWL